MLEEMERHDYVSLKMELADVIELFHRRGWSPATSTNYSFRNPEPEQYTFTITRSGVDKLKFSLQDLMVVDESGKAIAECAHLKPSAETLLHTMLYRNPENRAVLHTHSVNSTILSLAHLTEDYIYMSGYEVLKGIRGVLSHEESVSIPIFHNSQDMQSLSEEISRYYDNHPDNFGFLLAGHGLYAWGNSISEAKRHIEVYEFIFDCIIKLKAYAG